MADRIHYETIESEEHLRDFCQRSVNSKFIGFDTEFVSENRFLPELCLVQVATDTEYAIIDTIAVKDISPFWNLLVTGDHVTIAHAAREEFLFCYRECHQRPKNLFDIQLAAGMIGFEFPAAYGNLVSRLTGNAIDKGETRTDWMRRPLTKRQIDYALQDVVHLKPIYDSILASLEKMNRVGWFEEEMLVRQTLLEDFNDKPQWRKVSGISNLNPRALAIVRELWTIRNEEAQKKNRSAKRTLPDDLIVELAKRGSSDLKRLKAIRGFESRVTTSLIGRIPAAIDGANALSEAQLPDKLPRSKTINLGLLGQFLTTALKIVCQQEDIAASLVGTAQDIRDLAAWHLKMASFEGTPSLAEGWRKEIVGQLVEQILDGSVGIRVSNPKLAQPLVLEPLKPRN